MMFTDDPAIGKEIDGFQILDVLGRGGMGIVYKAEDTALSRMVALKMVDPMLARDTVFVQRFQGEARALARIDSPYIVRVHALRSTDAGLFIVMEYVDGGTIHDLPAPYPWRRALPLAKQMLTALEHAHGVGIIHRDIKPRNIMLSASGIVKVTDFGLAKLAQGNGQATMTQGIAGTLYYMSPEQVKGLATLDHRSDLYSLGMTLYELVAGRLPLDRDASEFATMRAIVEDKLPPPSKFRADIPPALDAIIMKALEKDPARRYQNAADMRAALEAFEANTQPLMPSGDGDATVQIGATPYSNAPVPKATARKPVFAAAGAAAVLMSLAGGYFFFAGPETDGPAASRASTLSVASMPSGATLFLNGRPAGVTPVHELPVQGESAALRFVLDGYAVRDTTVKIPPGEKVSLDLHLALLLDSAGADPLLPDAPITPASQIDDPRPSGRTDRPSTTTTTPEPPKTQATARLVLRANGSGALKVNGRAVSSGAASQVPAGTPVNVTCGEGNLATTQQVRLNPNQNKEYTCHFEATINVQAVADDGSTPFASITLNGQPTGDFTPYTLQLSPGTYRIGASKNGWESSADESITIKPTFEPKNHKVVIQLRKQTQ